MKVTGNREKSKKGFTQVYGSKELAARMVHVLQVGKQGLDSLVMEFELLLAEIIMDMEWEEHSSPDEAGLWGRAQVGLSGKVLSIAATKNSYQSEYTWRNNFSVIFPSIRFTGDAGTEH